MRTVGKSIAHDSAELHVAGTATYIDDILEPDGTVHVVPGFAKDGAVGKITALDLSLVLGSRGVLAVLTADDIPGINDCSPIAGDDPIFAKGEIQFHGQVIFAVVAETREAAMRARLMAKIEIQKSTPVVNVQDSQTNLLPPYAFTKGDYKKASINNISGEFSIGGQEHFYLEGQVAFAIPQEKNGMLVHSSTQHPQEIQHKIAAMLAIPDAMVVCECRRMGGGFGGKESQATQWAALAALAAHKLNRPAKCRLDRDDDFMMTGKRHDFQVVYEAGFDKTARLTAVDVNFRARLGYSADLSGAICDRTMFHVDNAYYYPAFNIATQRMKTNTVSNTAFRGFGGPQGIVFAEAMMQSIAIQTGMDALDVRKRNFYGPRRDVTPYGQKLRDNILDEIVAQLEKSSSYRKRRKEVDAYNKSSRFFKKGLALTPVKFGISFTATHLNQAGALVHVYSDGSVHLNHGGTEMGQGLYVKIAQVVAEVFGIALDRVAITATNTSKVPNTSATAASSGTDMNGMAARNAALVIKDRMAELIAKVWKVNKSTITFAGDKIKSGRHVIKFSELAKLAKESRVSLSCAGHYATPEIYWDRASGSGMPFFYFAYGASCSEVLVDTMTGEMKVTRVDILHDVGHSLNPIIDIGQIEGAFVQGMGWLTTEELVYDDDGKLRTHAPSTYKIPCASDVPEDFRVAIFKSKGNVADTIYRSKAVGEPPLMLPISVWCAVMDAVASVKPGTVPKLDTPATPEAILRAVNSL